MKKMLSMLLVFAMIFALAACASKSAPEAPETPAAEPETSNAPTAAEDGQNPVMNYIGNYACDRASMLIEADGADSTKISVTWGSSAFEHSEWVMTGTFDADTLRIAYSDCTRKDVAFSEDGSSESETVVYENGSGRIIFSEDGASLTWEDDEEQMADGMTFVNTSVEADYSSVTAMDTSDVELFAGMIKDAYINADWETLAEHVRYPITVDGTELKDAASLVAFLGERTVDPADQEAMVNETCFNMFYNGQGICLGDGEIWIIDPNYMTDAQPELVVIAINGVTK